MTIIRRPSPFAELVSLRQAMDRLFDDSFVRPTRSWASVSGGLVPLDVRYDREDVTIEAALPGFKPDDVEITVEDGRLTIRAKATEEREEHEDEYLMREIRREDVSRTVSLPAGLDAGRATATYENGMLTLRIPRTDEVKPRQIRISAVSDGQKTPSSGSTEAST